MGRMYVTLAHRSEACDGAWANENVRRLRSWLDSGAPPSARRAVFQRPTAPVAG
jgi:hypothetical protein